MKKLLLVLVIGLALGGCCYPIIPPRVTPTPASKESAALSLRAALERVKPQVFFQPRDAGEEELTNVPKSAGQGDRVRTPDSGKALLKWPDMHVMLYRLTEVKPQDVTPYWIKLAILAGVTVAGGDLPIDKRLDVVTDYAEIKVPGTTVMVAYDRETRLTIVRVFDGLAQVRNRGGAESLVGVSGGQWAYVEPGAPPVVSGNLSEMRDLARELGLWDTFHEVEIDVRDGFGAPGSQVPESRVQMVFVESQPEPPVEPPREPPVEPPPEPPLRRAEILPPEPVPIPEPEPEMLLQVGCGGFSDELMLLALVQAVRWPAVTAGVQDGETVVYAALEGGEHLDTRSFPFEPAKAKMMVPTGQFPMEMTLWTNVSDHRLAEVANRIGTQLNDQGYYVRVKPDDGFVCGVRAPDALWLMWR